MENTYELTECTREEFESVKTQLISDFIQQVTGAEVTNQLLGTGKIVSCQNSCNNLESVVFTVHFDLDETKRYGAGVALATGGLKFTDESMVELWEAFAAEQYKLKAQYNKAVDDDRRRQREAEKKAKQKEAKEKKKAEAKKAVEANDADAE